MRFAKDIKFFRDFLRLNGIHLRVYRDRRYPGYLAEADQTSAAIILRITPDWTRDSLISALLHELCHLWCYRNRIWYRYHRYVGMPKDVQAIRYTAVKAERYVDRLAESLAKAWFPEIKYLKAYRQKSDKHKIWEEYPEIFDISRNNARQA